MKKIHARALFIFRRDLRLSDNTALINAIHHAHEIVPIFIFDPRQVGIVNKYRSLNAIQFMIDALKDLELQFKKVDGILHKFHGHPETIITQLYDKVSFDAVFINRDYTPFSIKRDEAIATFCKKNNISFYTFHDVLLHNPEDIKKSDGSTYSIFTPFWKANIKLDTISNPQKLPSTNWYLKKTKNSESYKIYSDILPATNPHLHITGGRSQALNILKHIDQFKNYQKTRDLPAIPTTNLSGYIKFGCVSIRETYHAIGKALGYNHPLIRQLYWHDFYTYIAYHHPRIFGNAFHEKYNKLPWNTNKEHFKRWCTGTTGFPIVDAGMRQLNKTGYIHNRVRMIVASFLTKDLHIDWQQGEKYFAQHLIDYDPAINNGNWQWTASTGCDPQPYFRIFNPWLQQKKFDPECKYIKQWIPELKNLDTYIIHNWATVKKRPKINYPDPMLDHKTQSDYAKKIYKSVS